MNKLRPLLAIVLSIALFFTASFPLAETGLAAEPQKNNFSFFIPASLGTVKKITRPRATPSRKTVIQIEDVHGEPAVQAKISRMIIELARQGNVDLLAIEGAFEPLDLTAFQKFPYQDSVLKAAGTLLEKNLIPGAVHAALVSQTAIPRVVGIEDARVYEDNVRAYRRSRRSAVAIREKLSREKEKLARLKETVYSPELLAFDGSVQKYRSGKMELPVYAALLFAHQPQSENSLARFVNTLALEKKVHVPAVESERAWLVSSLAGKINPTLLRTSPAAFYRSLCELASDNHLEAKRYAHVLAYAHYLAMAESVSIMDVLADMRTAERQRYERLCRTPAQRRLFQEDQDVYWIGKLTDFSLSRDEWDEYAKRPAHRQKWNVEAFERFYIEAEQRDHLLVRRLLKSMESSGATTTVLVAGGFHSAGMAALLAENGVTTVTCTPVVDHIPASPTSYLNFFTQNHVALNGLFGGQKLFLALPVYKKTLMGTLAMSTVYFESLVSRDRGRFAFNWFRRVFTSSTGATIALAIGLHQLTFLFAGGPLGLRWVRPDFSTGTQFPLAVAGMPVLFGENYTWSVVALLASLSVGVAGVIARHYWRNRPQELTSFRNQYIKGHYFIPDLNINEEAPFDPSIIEARLPKGTLASQQRALKILEKAREESVELSITLPFRAADGPGSANDFYEYEKILTRPGALRLSELPSTITITSAENMTMRFSRLETDTPVEFFSNRPEVGRIVFNEPFDLREQTPHGMVDAPGYIFQLFGIRQGVKIEISAASLTAEAGGMEGSSVFVKALVEGASMLSGANLSKADIWLLATKLENDIFGGKTGGQGHLADLGGINQHIFFIKNGRRSALSIELLDSSQWGAVEDHITLAQAGGEMLWQPIISRNYGGPFINEMWMDFLNSIPASYGRFARQLGFDRLIPLAHEYAQALRNLDYPEMIRTTNELVDIRDAICKEWIRLYLMARPKRSWWKSWFFNHNPIPSIKNRWRFANSIYSRINGNLRKPLYVVLLEFLGRYAEDDAKRTSLYTIEPISDLVKAARLVGLAAMPVGAGGPGSNVMLISAQGRHDLRMFLDEQHVPERPMPDSTGKLNRRRIPFKIGGPARYNGFSSPALAALDVKLPDEPSEKFYNQKTGEFTDEIPTDPKQSPPSKGGGLASAAGLFPAAIVAFMGLGWGRPTPMSLKADRVVDQSVETGRDALYNRSALILIPPVITEADFNRMVQDGMRHTQPVYVVEDGTWMHGRLQRLAQMSPQIRIVAAGQGKSVFHAAVSPGIYEVQPPALEDLLKTSLHMPVQPIGWHIITTGDLIINIGHPRIDAWMNDGLFTIVSGGQSLLMGYASFAQHELDLQIKIQRIIDRNA